jgi:hypothetical protein
MTASFGRRLDWSQARREERRQTDREGDREARKEAGREAEKQAGREADRQRSREAEKQAGREAEVGRQSGPVRPGRQSQINEVERMNRTAADVIVLIFISFAHYLPESEP